MSCQDTKYKVQSKEISDTNSLLGVIQRKAKGVEGAGVSVIESTIKKTHTEEKMAAE